jgi:hypothetical protein
VGRIQFAWRARFPIVPLVSLRVVDWYGGDGGGLAARLWGLIPVTRARGDEVAKGESMRYLAELAWVPYAIVGNRELEWRDVDETKVEVATRVGGARAAVRLHFDGTGDIVAVSADARPRMVGKRAVDTPFSGRYGEYRDFGGLRVPTTGEVAWELSDGPFVYFRGRVIGLELD